MGSRGIVVWCVGRWTYRFIVVLWLQLVIGVVSHGGYWKSCVWLSPALAKLDVSQRLSCCVWLYAALGKLDGILSIRCVEKGLRRGPCEA